ncbi:iron complex outermembrane receptor protein [Zhongshania antarctica]|uniref:Iron complex outermembrane receptor protein n=1 Tax=Zhongshania antarctica TaxID=641702 RepID=A0A840R087_9GAMM|nr:TonB-dependent receptor [Zhongshania antarctica]MBB5186053.1 iron complex outermembrane receptor protein [Zhongshania antarctica]
MNWKMKIALAGVCVQPLNILAEDNRHMEHVLVTTSIHKNEAQTALPLTVLSGEELRRQAAATIGETLNHSPGLSSASFGPAVGQPVIRGQQGPRVQVLQNSLPSLDVSSNSADHAVSVEPILAESIEILRGPATLLYGGGAIGGVINVLDGRVPSKAIEGVNGAAELRHSSVDDGRSGMFRVDAGDGNWAVHIDSLYRDWGYPEIPGLAVNSRNIEDTDESSEGFIANADGRTRRTTLGSAYHFEDGYFGLSYSELDNVYGIPAGVYHHHDEENGVGAVVDEEAEEGVNLAVSQKRWDLAGDQHFDGFLELLRWRLAYSDYQHQEIEASGDVGTTFNKEAWTGRLELAHQTFSYWGGDWHGVFGAQWLEADFSALGEESFVPANTTRQLGLFWLEDYHAKNWSLEAGLRADMDRLSADQNSIKDHNTDSISASLAGLYELNDSWTASLSLSSSRRAPTAEERFSNIGNAAGSYVVHGATGAIELGDEQLDSEEAQNIDLSLRAEYEMVSAKIAVFSNQFNDFIYLENTGNEVDGVDVLAYRQQDATFQGLEYELDWSFYRSANQTYSLSLFGDRIKGELDNGDSAPRLPPGHDGVRLNWQAQNWQADLSVVYAQAQTKPGANELPTASYKRIDMTVSRAFDLADVQYTIMLKGRNLGDDDIRSASSFIRDYAPEAGRGIELALQMRFGDN